MPYIKRDLGGKIETSAPSPQPNWSGEFLPDDDAEIIAFMEQFAVPPNRLLTADEMKKDREEQERIAAEIRTLGDVTLTFLSHWASLENTCSRLFYDVVHCAPIESHVAYAIYHSLGGFEPRLTVLGAAIDQLIVENSALQVLAEPRRQIWTALREIKGTRNSVAHGTISTIQHNNHRYVRLTAPWFDVKKNAGQLRNHNIPGIDGSRLHRKLLELTSIIGAVGLFSRAIEQYRKYGDHVLSQAVRDIDLAILKLK